MQLISFDLSGDFAAFADPSVTSNQSAYFVPSKSAVIGLIGAMIGVQRDNTLKKWYTDEYLSLLQATKIGIRFDSEPTKITFFSNSVSLKETKTKPTKKEVLRAPRYKIYLTSTDEYMKKISQVLSTKHFAYTPCLGHSYCPARIENVKKINTTSISSKGQKTSSVVLDESESYNESFVLVLEPIKESRIIIERHLHHYLQEITDKKTKESSYSLTSRVLKHWIPVGGSEFKIKVDSKRDLSEFVKVGDQVVCLF